jgi:hypothetical protein
VFSVKLSKTCSLSSHIKSNKSAGSSFVSLKLQPQDWQNFATSSFGLVQEEQGEAGFQILGIPKLENGLRYTRKLRTWDMRQKGGNTYGINSSATFYAKTLTHEKHGLQQGVTCLKGFPLSPSIAFASRAMRSAVCCAESLLNQLPRIWTKFNTCTMYF